MLLRMGAAALSRGRTAGGVIGLSREANGLVRQHLALAAGAARHLFAKRG